MNSRIFRNTLLAVAILALFATVVIAQDTTTTNVTKAQPTKTYAVERGEVVYVSGDQVVVRLENGEIRSVTVPPGATAVVDGKTIGIADLKPGMKLQRTVTTTTTPQLITTIRTIQGTVWHVSPPKTVILTLGSGENKKYNVPKDQVFMIGDEKKTVFELKKGMKVTATVVTRVPETEVAHEKAVTGTLPPPPATPVMEGALLIEDAPTAKAAPAPAEVASAQKLPKTGSLVPLVGLLGMGFTLVGFGIDRFRK